MRKLATIRKINDLLPIEGADLIMTAVIDGWAVVVKKDEFKIGDHCVYFEIDSFLPDGNPAWQHLVDKHQRFFDGGKGHRLKTVKLRGQVSQGFAAPVSKFVDLFIGSDQDEGQELSEFFFLGNDLSEFLNIKKYEAPVPGELAGQVTGNFPTFIPKTDQERCQNIVQDIFVENKDSRYEVTLKADGTSFTAYYNNGLQGVCGRNWNLDTGVNNEHNTLVRMYKDSKLDEALRNLCMNYAVQGELMGPGIQKNREGLTSFKLFVFAIYDINAQSYLTPDERYTVLNSLYQHGLDRDMVFHTPVPHFNVTLADLGITNMRELLAFADGPSYANAVREGYVYNRMDGKFSFKTISNKYLLAEKE